MKAIRVLIAALCSVCCIAGTARATTALDYEPELRAMFGRVVSMAVGDSAQLTIPKTSSSPERLLTGAPTMYVFTAAQVLILRNADGGFLGAVVSLKTEVDEEITESLQTMFRSHESPRSIEFRLSEDRRRLIAFSSELIGKAEEKKTANQALQTTSVTRNGFGKVLVSDRRRRGV